jgi:hypothetical protein
MFPIVLHSASFGRDTCCSFASPEGRMFDEVVNKSKPEARMFWLSNVSLNFRFGARQFCKYWISRDFYFHQDLLVAPWRLHWRAVIHVPQVWCFAEKIRREIVVFICWNAVSVSPVDCFIFSIFVWGSCERLKSTVQLSALVSVEVEPIFICKYKPKLFLKSSNEHTYSQQLSRIQDIQWINSWFIKAQPTRRHSTDVCSHVKICSQR